MLADSAPLALALLVSSVGCMEERVVQPAGDSDAGPSGSDGGIDLPDTDAGDEPVMPGACNMTGRWIQVQVTRSTALGATQKAVNWFYHDIVQDPGSDEFTVSKSLNCGLKVTGTTTVTIGDPTTEALAKIASNSTGRKGTFKPTADGKCDFSINRVYTLHGAKIDAFLKDHWKIGDPPMELNQFPPLPADAAAGMEDWEADGKEGITLTTGLGPRYVAQRAWTQDHGLVAQSAAKKFGGEGVIIVDWDSQEKVSTQTSPLLQQGSTPMGKGYSFWEKVDDRLTVVTTGAHPELETCKKAVAIALTDYPNP